PPPPPYTLSLHDALPIYPLAIHFLVFKYVDGLEFHTACLERFRAARRKTALRKVRCAFHEDDHRIGLYFLTDDLDCLFAHDMSRSEEHTSELQSRFDLVC